MAYFLLSVANRVNLELCIEYALAGFTNSINGLWTFVDIEEGDFVSFLYGARVFNLYRVEEKEALKGVDIIGPWPSVTFQMSGKTYYFPFRLRLKLIRDFTESMVRPELAYVPRTYSFGVATVRLTSRLIRPLFKQFPGWGICIVSL